MVSVLFSSMALSAIDNNAESVQLSLTCTDNGSNLDNCFTTISALNSWIWGVRQPDANNPLLVKMGPGSFEGQLSCNNSGHVSFEGSGMGVTVLHNPSTPISVNKCVDMSFSNFTVKNTQTLFGISWQNGGTSKWVNMELDMIGYAWFEHTGSGCYGREPGEHHWFSSVIKTTTAAGSSTAYYAPCDVTWFFGSELSSSATAYGKASTLQIPGGELHVYGSVIRALSADGVETTTIDAVDARSGGEIHIHGTGIDVISAEANDIVALKASGNSHIHAYVSSYVLRTAEGGTKTRIINDSSMVMAPFNWGNTGALPVIASTTGSDLVVTSNTSDGQPHLLVYSENCANKWYDTVTGSCH